LRSPSQSSIQPPRQKQDLDNDDRPNTGAVPMTSRGTKYWNSGAIPLIAPEILGDIIAQVADVGVVISENGTVLSVLVNPGNDTFNRLERWEGRDLREVLTVESVPKFDERLQAFLDGAEQVRPVELNHSESNGRWEAAVKYSFHRIGPDGAILLLGRDLQPIAEMQQQLVRAQLALERDYEVQREYDTRFRVLMESMAEAVFFVSAETGEIAEANRAAGHLFDTPVERLTGQPLADCFDTRKRGDLVETLVNHAISAQNKPVQGTLPGGKGRITIFPTLFRAAGERVLLCRMAFADAQLSAADDLGTSIAGLFHSGPEAIIFVAESGDILSANDAFLDLIDVAHDINVRGRSFADFLQRGSVDFKVMIENAARTGRMRSYATKIAGDYGRPRPIDVSVTKLDAGHHTVFGFVMRDSANRIETGASTAATSAHDSMQSVVELVGSATLKDIVAETTNVVEKMCIETAVELTMNNRVAAAEMLGLSRQSLYVKLRKFDLLSRDADEDE